jgi:hypothetical protein
MELIHLHSIIFSVRTCKFSYDTIIYRVYYVSLYAPVAATQIIVIILIIITTKIIKPKYRNSANVEHEMLRHASNFWGHRNYN